jgi:hypothetical protein
VAAAPQADCELHLTLLSIEESGAAEYSDDYGSRARPTPPRRSAAPALPL